ncbi:MAG: PAS domain S-box protein [Desulfosarcinaceae bacterium]
MAVSSENDRPEQLNLLQAQDAEQAHNVLDHLPTLICTFLPDGTLTYVNRAYADYFQKSRAQLIGRCWLDFLPAEEKEKARAVYLGLGRENPVHTHQHRMKAPDGRFRWHEWTNVATFGPDGRLREFQSIGEDITQRKQTQEQLRAILQACADPLVAYNMFGHPLFINHAFTDVFGWTHAELEGRTIPFVPPEEKAVAEAQTSKLFRTGEPARFETRRLTKDGRLLNVLISAAMVKGADGRATGMVVNLTNITERKKLEAQFQQAQKLEAIGTLAGGIAHDFNNILSAIMGYTELSLAAVENGNPILEAYLKKIELAGNRAKDLVKQILTFSRQADQELRPLQPKTVLKEALKLIRATLPSSIQIKPELLSDAHIMADITQIHQVLLNLCTNAGHALEDRPGVISIRLEDMDVGGDSRPNESDLPPGSYLKLTVADDGIGMPPGLEARIFDPFFTTKPKEKGTGMGLSLVHGIIKSYGGHINVQSTVGQGTTFSVFIPRIKDIRDEQTQAPVEPIPMGREHILMVDDEAPIVEIGRIMLERLGYRVTSVDSSVEALRIFSENPDDFDLVITDLTMPNLTGDKLAIRILDIRPDMPVIACTGFGEDFQSHDNRLEVFRKTILKPVILRDMGNAIREVLDK